MKLDRELSDAIKKFIINGLDVNYYGSLTQLVPDLLKLYIEGEGVEDREDSEPEPCGVEETKCDGDPVDNEVLPGKWYLWEDRRPTDFGGYLVVKNQARKVIYVYFDGEKRQFKNVRCFMKLPEAPELEIGEWE